MTSRLFLVLILATYSLHLLLATVSAFPANNTNNALPNLVPSTNLSALAAPEPPPGFNVHFDYDTTKPLNPIGVYLCAIDSMYHFAQAGWHTGFDGGLTLWAPRYGVQVDFDAKEMAHGSPGLETSHVVAGLYKTVVNVAAASRFCQVIATLLVQRRQIGTVRIAKGQPSTLGGGVGATNTSIVDASAPSNAITYPSGQYDDVDDPGFTIQYTYSGTRLNSKSIFLATLDALATAAQFSPPEPFDSLVAISPDGGCVINVVKSEGPYDINYSFVTKTLRLMISDIMLVLNKFEEITLRLKWQGSLMAVVTVKQGDRGVVAQE